MQLFALDSEGLKHLEGILDGLPVPTDGLELGGNYNNHYRNERPRTNYELNWEHIGSEVWSGYPPDWSVRLRTPSSPSVAIKLSDDPLNPNNWGNAVNLARSLEAMFR